MKHRGECLCLVHLVFFLLIFCFSASSALANPRWSKGLDLGCIDECDNMDIREYLLCQRDCELQSGEYHAEEEEEEEEEPPQYGRTRMDPRWQQPQRGGETIPERTAEDEYERCLRRCEPAGAGGREDRRRRWRPQQCEDLCEELRRARERKRDWEREREVLFFSVKERLDRCLSRCEKQPGGQQKQLCRFRCRQHQ
ncbi:hypothetical protein SAY86_031007 [Trapa natans]|uniref:Uncharacterized protein n=1 Tax=Trapa natans TaxID=22666 RepID=A0AAN7MP95_TRANT|nr:hypothetical protein SAY86_031007 [Trapa natans]